MITANTHFTTTEILHTALRLTQSFYNLETIRSSRDLTLKEEIEYRAAVLGLAIFGPASIGVLIDELQKAVSGRHHQALKGLDIDDLDPYGFYNPYCVF